MRSSRSTWDAGSSGSRSAPTAALCAGKGFAPEATDEEIKRGLVVFAGAEAERYAPSRMERDPDDVWLQSPRWSRSARKQPIRRRRATRT
jgi:hypothetical protein